MSTQDLATLTGIVATVTGGVAVGIKWTVKHYLSELKPNSGSSLKDQVTQLGASQKHTSEEVSRLGARVDAIYQFLLEKK